MAVEIEKPAVSFTDEAQRALQTSLQRVERRIRAKAADLAIKARGTPTEVTASDIEKAYRELIGSGTRDVFPGKTEIDRKLGRKTINLRFISTLYVWFGVLIALCGVTYPFIRPKLIDPSVRFSVLVGLSGLLVAALGQGLKAYLNYSELLRKEENSRRYTRVIDFYQKP